MNPILAEMDVALPSQQMAYLASNPEEVRCTSHHDQIYLHSLAFDVRL